MLYTFQCPLGFKNDALNFIGAQFLTKCFTSNLQLEEFSTLKVVSTTQKLLLKAPALLANKAI
ncbi:MAG: hypothetical protein ABR95_06505 [Sphingobacteriales bacterium BACL12 MAG-120813-bin55]|jgi:hypothetical protein|nr:MAG: hypothetical protein ABR95_06505 [Sphingobacteriales bacterium BACL12 MAG-120813-bin55]KRP09456.1 MAG: hypothetical protein ABR94_13210 [Sphingobacteriales bacterium BACL12 MAG-120802-bin5]